MYFRQILHLDLGCASYLVADQGEAAVIDPKWEIDEYLEAAREAGAEIRHVLETHTHADHVSGRRRLAAITGAQVHVPAGADAVRIADGDEVRVGEATLTALATPGHRPEHLAFLVTHRGEPERLLSGDSLLVGNVARPDLAVQAEEGARELWSSLRSLIALGDDVEVWPAHVGASLCASGNASEATSSTIARERASNALLSLADVNEFTSELSRCTPARPPTVECVVALNLGGAGDPGPVPELDASCLAQCIGPDICLLDIRDPDSFDAAHLAGSINLPRAGQGLGTRAGWAAGPSEPIVLVAPSFDAGRRAIELLRAAGLWNLAGLTIAEPIAWAVAGLDVQTSDSLSPDRLVPRFRDGEVTLIDVRDPGEWSSGHIPGSRHLPLSELGDGSEAAESLNTPVAVVCASGFRAALAASILRRRGGVPVARVVGGVQQVAGQGIALVRDEQ